MPTFMTSEELFSMARSQDERAISRMVGAAMEAARDAERKRCIAIVSAARFGEIDGDLRCLISRMEGGKPFPEDKQE